MRPALPALLAALLIAPPASAVTFNDGAVHVIDAANSFPFDIVGLEDSPGAGITTVRVVGGGQVTAINASGSSVVEMLGGIASGGGGNVGIAMEDSSLLLMSGGLAEMIVYRSSATSEISGAAMTSGKGIIATAGILNISGGSVLGSTGDSLVEGGVVNLSGGDWGNWTVTGGSLFVSGGTHEGLSTELGGTLEVTGGIVRQAGGRGLTSISGGDIQDVVTGSVAGASGFVEISGGTISGQLLALGASSMEIAGTGFNFPLGDISPTTGTLLGTLSDGSALNVSFGRASTATITLVAVPAAVTIAGFTFNAGAQAFADDAFVTSGSVTGADAATVRSVLVGSNTEDSIRVTTPDVAEIEVSFSDNAISNGAGTDLVIFERSGSTFPVGSADPNERFELAIWHGAAFTPFVSVDPVNTGTVSPSDPTLSLYVVEIDLDDFGFATAETTQRIKIRLVDNLVSRSADPTAFGARNSVVASPPAECEDGTDNDGDGLIDFAQDPGCTGSGDTSEQDPSLACDDGMDNDGDGLVDFAEDPDCTSPSDPLEAPDFDADGVQDSLDNCVLVPNPSQADADGDGVGDACNDINDGDGDEWSDSLDNCPGTPNASQLDSDNDRLGDACDSFPSDDNNRAAQCEVDLAQALADSDNDGVPDVADNCIDEPNGPNDGPNQQMDTDGDLIGNVCDCDFDQDGACAIDDFNEFASDFASGDDGGTGTDMDGDGSVGVGDFNYFLPGFGDGAPGPSGLVP